MTYISSTSSNNPVQAGNSTTTAPASWASILDMLRRLAQELHVATVQQASDATALSVKAAQGAAQSQVDAGQIDRNLTLLGLFSSGTGALAGVAGGVFGVRAVAQSNEAAKLDLAAAKVDHGLNMPSANRAQANPQGVVRGNYEAVKREALSEAHPLITRPNHAPETRGDWIRARDELKAEAKKASGKAQNFHGFSELSSKLLDSSGKLIESSTTAELRAHKGVQESLRTLLDTQKETAGAINQTARSGISSAEQLVQTVESTRVELSRTLNLKG